jgi:peptidyl-prolyl cis-trans isomerase D
MPDYKKAGKFDRELFERSLQENGTNEVTYLNGLREQIGSKAMIMSIDNADASVPQSVLALNIASGLQTRDAVVFTIASANTPSVSEDEAKSYYQENTNQYEQPEVRTLEYVTLDRADLEKLAPADATPEAREEAVQEMASQVEDALAGGSAMGEAIAQAGIKAQSKILTDITAEQIGSSKDALLHAVAEQGFQLGEGESSGLVSAEDGRYFMVGVKKITPASPKPYEQVAALVKQEVAKEKARDETKARVQALKEALAKGEDWKKAAADAKAAARQVSNIERPLIGIDGKLKGTEGAVPPLLQQAIFEHGVGDAAGPLVREDGSQLIALVTAVHSKKAANETANIAAAAQYKSELGNAITNAVFRELSNRYKVHVNDEMLRQLEGGNE